MKANEKLNRIFEVFDFDNDDFYVISSYEDYVKMQGYLKSSLIRKINRRNPNEVKNDWIYDHESCFLENSIMVDDIRIEFTLT
jgi:hypothetical protein